MKGKGQQFATEPYSNELNHDRQDEMKWADQRRQQERDMAEAVARARARREEEERLYDLSRQAAQEKAKQLAKKDNATPATPADTKAPPTATEEKTVILARPQHATSDAAPHKQHETEINRNRRTSERSEEKVKVTIIKKEVSERHEATVPGEARGEGQRRVLDGRTEPTRDRRHHDESESHNDQNRRHVPDKNQKPRKNSDRQEPSLESGPRVDDKQTSREDDRNSDVRRQPQDRNKQQQREPFPTRKISDRTDRRPRGESNASSEGKSSVEQRTDDKRRTTEHRTDRDNRDRGDRNRDYDHKAKPVQSNIPPRFQKLRGAVGQASAYGPPPSSAKPAFEKPKAAFDQQEGKHDKVVQPSKKSSAERTERADRERKNGSEKTQVVDAKVSCASGCPFMSFFARTQGLAVMIFLIQSVNPMKEQ